MSMKEKAAIPNYISVQQYADNHNISVLNLLEDIIAGKYKSAICIIGSDEDCVTSNTSNPTTMAEVSNPDEFISAREFAQLHDLNYAVLVRKLKEGKYESAIKDKSNRWYIRQDEEIDGCREGYVTAKEYAEQNGISYSVMTSELNRGYYKSAYQDSGRRWYLLPSDVRDNTPIPDPALEGYVTMKEFAAMHGVHYGLLSEDVRKGVYDSDIIRPNSRFIYIKETAECKTAKYRDEIKGYLSLQEYAEDRGVDYKKLKNDVIKGVYSTAKKVSNRWYIKETEKCKTVDIPHGYILASDFANRNHISYRIILDDIKAGVYETSAKIGYYWYIDRNEKCKSVKPKKIKKSKKQKQEKSKKNYISVSAYAKLHNFSAQKVRKDVLDGLYETAIQKGSRWFIDKDEPCKSVDNRRKNV